MPMCARCLGASVGHIAAFIFFIVDLLPPLLIIILCIIPLLIDWSLQYCNILQSTNQRRLITGLAGGFGVGSLLWIFTTHAYSFSLNIIGGRASEVFTKMF